MDYNKTVKQIREMLLVTQVELAEMLGVSFATINRWERGHHAPSIRQRRSIRELCHKNGIPMEE